MLNIVPDVVSDIVSKYQLSTYRIELKVMLDIASDGGVAIQYVELCQFVPRKAHAKRIIYHRALVL